MPISDPTREMENGGMIVILRYLYYMPLVQNLELVMTHGIF
ncbi:MAG: hypothetical protein NTW65_06900 [Deltaproteobacteria bacterium]|nr:hypothetical protein [Deltaproteobacteria bacterium]